MVEHRFNNYLRLEELVASCWGMEKVEDHIAKMGKPRMQFVEEASPSPCLCADRWAAECQPPGSSSR